MTKIAKLVYVSLMTRVVVDEGATDEEIMELAVPKLSENFMNAPFENLESIIDDIECPYEDGEEYVDKYGFMLSVGDDVDVPYPNDTDIHSQEFTGCIEGFKDGYVVVIDGDGDCFSIEPKRLKKFYY